MSQDNEEIERELRERFGRLRGEEAGSAPDLSLLLRRPARQARGSLATWRLGVVLATAALIAVVVGLSRKHQPDPAYAIDLASTSWHGPTDFLLVFPDDETLRTVPRLGEMDLNWRTP